MQRLAGHTEISTTMRYVHLNDDDVRAAMAKEREESVGILPPIPSKRRLLPSPIDPYKLLTKILWSWRRDLNPRPSDYKSDALPTELRQLIRNTVHRGKVPLRLVLFPSYQACQCVDKGRGSIQTRAHAFFGRLVWSLS